ncbi:MAG: Holliday junction branch migration protein RuvA [bacterium]|nr:Holliday junction branch migration protein RuvA [bacterium]
MIYSISGKLVGRHDNIAIIETGGIGFKVFLSPRTAQSLPQIDSQIKLFCSMYNRENEPFELFGFINERELYLFDKLNTVSGIGPKTALGILSVAPIEQLATAINENKTDLLTKASGIGKKTAERIMVDLKGKLELSDKDATTQTLNLMESDIELEDTLISLGYNKQQARAAIAKIDPQTKGFKDRLREALRKNKGGQ